MSYPDGMMAAWDGPGTHTGSASRCRPARGGARLDPGAAVARFAAPDGWTVQAFTSALDCTPRQTACVRRQFGGRRYARNRAVRAPKDDIARYRETGQETEKPSLASPRKRWNRAKDTECADAETGKPWWPQISYGSRLIVAGRFCPSSKTCCACGHAPDIGWAEHWTCGQCGTCRQRDDNAAGDLARYEPPAPGDSAVGPVGPPSSAEPAVRPGPARQAAMKRGRDDEARKGRSRTAAEQPRDGGPTG
jgi:hypothetical protein